MLNLPWRLVILESPFAGWGRTALHADINPWGNRRYLDRCIRHCIERGDSPYASHKMLTKALSDMIPEERARGIQAGFAWGVKAEAVVVYIDRGVSPGMFQGIDVALKEGRLVEYYSIHEPSKLMLTRQALEAYRL